ncbi:MAG: S8 family serine peptidase [Bacteroidetes bacterium]|nr:S8 family serine peptidase [Bacteroidota bacterium]
MKKITLLVAALAAQLFCNAQDGRYQLMLSSGLVEPTANFEQVKSSVPNKSELFNGNYFRYIQFNSLPTEQQKSELESKGVKLMLYLPTNTFMAAIKENTSLQTLSGYNIRGIYSIKAEYKLLKELSEAIKENNFPGYAVKGNKIGIGITAYQNISFEAFKQQLLSKGYEITFEDQLTNWVVTWVNKNDLLNFINQPFICSAELVDDTPQPDNNVGRTSHRSNAISTSYSGGRKYNGNGVQVMLQDDGIIGPHIDYQGRLPMQFMTSNSGDHGDHCAGIIMAAGNKDPLTRGMAWGSDIYVYNASPSYQGFDSINSHYGKYGIRIISTSYSDGCNAGYTTRAQQLDIQNLSMPQLIHVFSAGNNGTSNCSYGAGAGWGNVTGGHKHSKNSIAVANLDYLDVRNSSSSRGPAHDGRLKPEVSAVGTNVYSTSDPNNYVTKTGTSMSCPGVAGVFAQLYEAYKALNSGNNPPSALMKAIVMNTADDLGNPGPDFSHGYGRVNALNAVKAIETVAYTSGTVSTGATNIHNITVPAGVRQMKVLTYWHDYQAAVSASVALVNNLNTFISTPSATTVNPLVLNYTPNATTLNLPATQGVDIRNNHEQVVISNPAAGNYALNVTGAAVPMGPQAYYVTWIFYMDGYTLTYPMGGEGFVPGETETIRWDAFETTGNQTLEYSTNGGSTWTTISTTIAGNQRHYNWTVPAALSGQCRVRISRGAYNDASDANFSIIPLPSNLQVNWACPDSVRLTWNAASGATSYDIFKLGTMYMDSIGTSSTTSFVVPNAFSTQTYWFSVRARGPLGAVGRRMIAIQKTPGTFSCPMTNDAACNNLVSPSGTIPNCQNLTATPVTINLFNAGVNAITTVPVYYRVNSGPIVSETYTGTIAPSGTVAYTFSTPANVSTIGNYNVKAWAKYVTDMNVTNDSAFANVSVVSGTTATLPLTEDFETFALCGTSNVCSTVCGLGNGFINESNTIDQHDWRTDEGGTPSANTGPIVDYSPGTSTGNYVYLESSTPCVNLTANLLSPCVDLSTITNPMLSFAYHMYGTDMGTLYVDILANGAWTNNVWSMTGNKGNSWFVANISLSAWASQKINVRWRGVTGANFLSDMALDAINIQSSTNIDKLTSLDGIMVYPNPGSGDFNLNVNGLNNTELSYTVTDISGKIILQNNAGLKTGSFNTVIDLKEAASGMYFLQIKRGEETGYLKLIKN